MRILLAFASSLTLGTVAPAVMAEPLSPDALKADLTKLNPGMKIVNGLEKPPATLVPAAVAKAEKATVVDPLDVSLEVVAKPLGVRPTTIATVARLAPGADARVTLPNGTKAKMVVAAPTMVSYVTGLDARSRVTIEITDIPAGKTGTVVCTVSNPTTGPTTIFFGYPSGLEALFGTIRADFPTSTGPTRLLLPYGKRAERFETYELWTSRVAMMQGCVISQDR